MNRYCLLLLFFFFMLPVVAQVPDKGAYKTIENISYRTSDDAYINERCRLDLYYPEASKDFVTIVWFHGGGLSGGNKFIPQQLKEAGYAVVAVNYRLLPKATLADCIDDAAAAVAWVLQKDWEVRW